MAERIVIIGAGQAGVQAASSIRAGGHSGELVLAGEEPYLPYQRPPLSKAYLAGNFARERLTLKPESFFADTRCDLRLSARAVRIAPSERRVEFESGETLDYDSLLLATGARVRRIGIPGADLDGIHYLRGIDDVDSLRARFAPGARLVIVGGGYIGLEVAAVAVKAGLDVTIVETASRLMERAASPIVSEFYRKEHEARGVRIMLGAGAERFEGETRVEAVATNKGKIAADFVLVCIGIVPNIELAAAAGLETGNGIAVDAFARTSDSSIYAAGDCTDHPAFAGGRIRLESVQNAIDQAKHAALAMLGKPKPYREVPWFWSDQYDLKLQIAGIARPGDRAVVRGDPASRKFAVFHLRGDALAAVEAVCAAPEYVAGRVLIAAGTPIAAEKLADTAVPMKSLI